MTFKDEIGYLIHDWKTEWREAMRELRDPPPRRPHMPMREAVTLWLDEWRERCRWVVRDWSTAHPPRTRWLTHTVLTVDEVMEYIGSIEYRSAYDRASADVAVAAWLTARGQTHRLPEEFR